MHIRYTFMHAGSLQSWWSSVLLHSQAAWEVAMDEWIIAKMSQQSLPRCYYVYYTGDIQPILMSLASPHASLATLTNHAYNPYRCEAEEHYMMPPTKRHPSRSNLKITNRRCSITKLLSLARFWLQSRPVLPTPHIGPSPCLTHLLSSAKAAPCHSGTSGS